MGSSIQGIKVFDNPWHRLRWTAPAAMVAWALIIATFFWLINEPVVHPASSLPIDAELIEDPPPADQAKPEPEPKKAEPLRTVQAVDKPQVTPVLPVVSTPVDSMPATPAKAEASPAPAPNETAAPANNSNARAIYRPMPAIPEDLREEAFSAAALARFDVAVDGTVTVTLIKPTQNPRLNRMLLETLKTWRFFPELKNGKPTPSSQELVVRFEVK